MDIERKRQVPGEFKVINYEVRDFTGNYTCMDYGDPNAPRLAQLREEFDLEAIVDDYDSEFEGMLALKRWVRSQWDHGWSRSGDKVKDALDILHEAAKGEQFNCGYYSIVFSECATALGWPARRLGLTIMDCEFPRDFNVGNVGHSVVEIWSDEYEKWVIMDSDLNVYYERDGVPLNALEIRDAWLSGCADQVEMVQDEPAFVQPSAGTVAIHREISEGYEDYDLEVSRFTNQRFTRHRVIDYYARVNIAGWEWVDDRGLPTFVRHFGPSGRARWTSNLADMYWSLNMVRMSAAPSWDDGNPRLAISLEHCMPFFDHYEVRVNGSDWERREAEFDWPMHDGINSLECRGVNVMHRPGIISKLDVAYARPRW